MRTAKHLVTLLAVVALVSCASTVAIAQGGNGGNGGNGKRPNSFRAKVMRVARMLDKIRAKQMTQEQALQKMRTKMQSRNAPDIDKKLAGVSKILAQAVQMSNTQYEQQRTTLAVQIVRINSGKKGKGKNAPATQ